MNAYLDDSNRALKPRPVDDEPIRQGPPAGRDLPALISVEEGANLDGP